MKIHHFYPRLKVNWDEIYQEYLKESQTMVSVARRYNIVGNTVSRNFKRLGFKLKPHSEISGLWNKGKKLSLEHRQKLSIAKIGKYVGEKHPCWKGDNSYKAVRKRDYKTHRYKEFRKGVFKRDNYTCLMCGQRGGYKEVHHIKSYKDYPKLRYEPANGITICKKCHVKTDGYGVKQIQ